MKLFSGVIVLTRMPLDFRRECPATDGCCSDGIGKLHAPASTSRLVSEIHS
jgi:hypothetical protein